MTMSNSGTPPIPPIVPLAGGDGDDGLDEVSPFEDDDDAALDPDVDADQVDSAEADVRASTAGTKDGDLER